MNDDDCLRDERTDRSSIVEAPFAEWMLKVHDENFVVGGVDDDEKGKPVLRRSNRQ